MAPRRHVIAALPLLFGTAAAVNNGLARTPQMGWNNWNSLACDVSESLLLDTSRNLVSLGLRDVGYNYVVLDDCWSDGRDAEGSLVPDSGKFPRGMKFISETIHNMGMLFGMYSSAGELTCAKYSGSLDREEQDARSFAAWGVDYLKYDNCYAMGRHGTPKLSFDRYDAMAQALKKTGRSILYSLCNWGEDHVHSWGVSIANSWRMSGDIYDSFSRPDALCACDDPRSPHCIAPGTHCSVLNIINKVSAYTDRGQPGGWNDLDMLEVGNGGMNDDEYKAHFTMWAIIKSPLLIGADISRLPANALSILNNPAIIAVSQDPRGRPANRVMVDYNVKKDKYGIGETQIWVGPLANGDHIVVFLNAADEEVTMEAPMDEIFAHDGTAEATGPRKMNWDVYDLWGARMSEEAAEALVKASASQNTAAAQEAFKHASWYNSTELPYSEGLLKEDPRLFGVFVEAVEPTSTLKAAVPRHGVAAFRLRSKGMPDAVLHSEL